MNNPMDELQKRRQKRQQTYSTTSNNNNNNNTYDAYTGNPYQEILDRKRIWENNPNKQNTQQWAESSADQFYNMLSDTEAAKVSHMDASALNDYIQSRERQAPDEIDFDKYKTDMATIEDLKKKWGFDYSFDYAQQIAEAQAQAKRDAAENKQQEVTNTVQNSVEGMNQDFFQQFLQQQQGLVNSGMNAGIAQDANLRLAMARNSALGEVYAGAQEERMAIQDALARIEQEKIATANQLYNQRLQQAFENALSVSQFRQSDSLARLEAALAQRGQNIDMSQFLQNLDFQRGQARGNVTGDQARDYLQAIIDAKQAWSEADTDAERAAAHERAESAREQLALLGYNSSLVSENVTLEDALSNMSDIGETIRERQLEQQQDQFDRQMDWEQYRFNNLSAAEEEQARQFAERLGFERYQFNNLSAYQKSRLAEQARQFNISTELDRGRLDLAWAQLREEQSQFDTMQAWREYEYNNMSASDRARLDENIRQFNEDMAWRMYEMEQTMGYYNSNFNSSSGGGDAWVPHFGGEYEVTSDYGGRNNPTGSGWEDHGGVDFGVPKGTRLGALTGGKVVHAGYTDGGFGYYVAVKDSYGNVHIYGHMSSVAVDEGDVIEPGSYIGKSGNTGQSTGAHLHYEVREGSIGGRSLDPRPYLN